MTELDLNTQEKEDETLKENDGGKIKVDEQPRKM
jgi:hypothetical protein